jgi:putative hemolysin
MIAGVFCQREGKKHMKRLLLMLLVVGILIIAACGAEPTPIPTKTLPTAIPTKEPAEATPDEGTLDSPLAPSPTLDASGSPLATPGPDAFESPVGLPNPASKFCEDSGYILELRTDANGTAGYCIFPDGSECEEWAFFRGECAPGTPTP